MSKPDHAKSLATEAELQNLLPEATREEVSRWAKDGRIGSQQTTTVYRYGQPRKIKLYDRGYVKSLRGHIEGWRKKDAKTDARTVKSNAQKAAVTKEMRRARLAAIKRIRDESGYGAYPDLFPHARAAKRSLKLICGPTNSGKTYEALTLAGKAASAQVLSPLRLLAFEHYEALLERGLDAGLVTGEEAINDQHASHIARTIETADMRKRVEVCVIDEIQMLDDAQRGWAWTAAAVGANAETVVMTGSEDAIPLVKRIAAMTGEPLEIVRLERKSPLHALTEPVAFDDIGAGDAVIAFTRRDVHVMRERLLAKGKTVAVIYGALGPEVRRAEAARFRSGLADVVVATDAIGMGLNLGPIRRVLFSALEKYDGKETRPLTGSEIRQIGGRAGRYGHVGEGFVGLINLHGSWKVKAALEGKGAIDRELMIVMPDRDTVALAAEAFDTTDIVQVMNHLKAHLVEGSQTLEMADLDDMLKVASAINVAGLTIQEKFSYACAPVQTRSGRTLQAVSDFAAAHAAEGEVAWELKRPTKDLEDLEDQARQATLYLWLAKRFADTYPDVDEARAVRDRINEQIEERLKSGAATLAKAEPWAQGRPRAGNPHQRRGYAQR